MGEVELGDWLSGINRTSAHSLVPATSRAQLADDLTLRTHGAADLLDAGGKWTIERLRHAVQQTLICNDLSPLDLLRSWDHGADSTGAERRAERSLSKREFLLHMKRMVNDTVLWELSLRQLTTTTFAILAGNRGKEALEATDVQAWLGRGWAEHRQQVQERGNHSSEQQHLHRQPQHQQPQPSPQPSPRPNARRRRGGPSSGHASGMASRPWNESVAYKSTLASTVRAHPDAMRDDWRAWLARLRSEVDTIYLADPFSSAFLQGGLGGPVREYALCAGNAIDMKRRAAPPLPPPLPYVTSAPNLTLRHGATGRAAPGVPPPGMVPSPVVTPPGEPRRAPPPTSPPAPTRHMSPPTRHTCASRGTGFAPRRSPPSASATRLHDPEMHHTSPPQPPGRKRAASTSHPQRWSQLKRGAMPEGRSTLWRLADRNPVVLHASTPVCTASLTSSAWRMPPGSVTQGLQESAAPTSPAGGTSPAATSRGGGGPARSVSPPRSTPRRAWRDPVEVFEGLRRNHKVPMASKRDDRC